jgi:DNA-binding response OmpR family regulator
MAKILIVEDDKVLSNAYKLILEKHGHEVATAFNGIEALDATKSHEPTVIFLDLLMPEMDGIEFLSRYNLKKHPNVTVIVLSNMGDDKKVHKAMELGAYKYIVKAQATPDELSLLVNHIVSKKLKQSSPDK